MSKKVVFNLKNLSQRSKRSNSHFDFAINNSLSKAKRSQITPIIIVAVLIAAIIIVFYFSAGKKLYPQNINNEVKPIYDYVQECIKETGERAILDNSNYGGYFISPEESLENGIPYYARSGKNLMPNKEKIEDEIGNYISTLTFFCIKNFATFEDYVIDEKEIKTNIDIQKDKVVMDVSYPLSITKGENSYNLKSFYLEVPTRLGVIYDSAEFIVNDQVKYTKSICITCLDQISNRYDFYVNAIEIDDKNVIYTIKDEKIKINNETLVFNFASELEEI